MKIGHEYEPDRVYPRHFDQLAEEAKLSAAVLRRRVVDMAVITLSKLPDSETVHAVEYGITEFIRKRCDHTIDLFRK